MGLSIDDFGAGYSSLAALRIFPVDVLKLGAAFVADVGTPQGGALVSAITTLAGALDMRAWAAGVEDAAQAAALDERGYDVGQGYHFSGPVEADALADIVGAQPYLRLPAARPGLPREREVLAG